MPLVQYKEDSSGMATGFRKDIRWDDWGRYQGWNRVEERKGKKGGGYRGMN